MVNRTLNLFHKEAAGHPFRGNQYTTGQSDPHDAPTPDTPAPSRLAVDTTASNLPAVFNVKAINNVRDTLHLTPEQLTANYLSIYDDAKANFSDEEAKTSLAWYSIAHDQITSIAKDTGQSPAAVAGSTAVLSRLMDWDKHNVRIVKDLAAKLSDPNFTVDAGKDTYDSKGKLVSGTKWVAAMMVKNTGHAPTHKAGDKLSSITDPYEVAYTLASMSKQQGWRYAAPAGYDGYVQAVRLLRGESPNDVIQGSKLRSFYNNLMFPDDRANMDVTIDTHMFNAGAKKLITDPRTLSSLSSKPSMITGKTTDAKRVKYHGTHAVFAEAVRAAAKQRGVAPAELQALVWSYWKHLHPIAEKKAVSRERGQTAHARGTRKYNG